MALTLTKRTQSQASIIHKCGKAKLHNISTNKFHFLRQNQSTRTIARLFYLCSKRTFAVLNNDDDSFGSRKHYNNRIQFDEDDEDDDNDRMFGSRSSNMSGKNRRQGIVKWFDSVKGYGFITDENSSPAEDYFVHYSNLHCNTRFKSIEQGSSVEFEIGQGNGGKKQAINVTGPGGDPVTPEQQQQQQQQSDRSQGGMGRGQMDRQRGGGFGRNMSSFDNNYNNDDDDMDGGDWGSNTRRNTKRRDDDMFGDDDLDDDFNDNDVNDFDKNYDDDGDDDFEPRR